MMAKGMVTARCAWCGTTAAGVTCPACGHDLGAGPEDCACPACRQWSAASPQLLADVQQRDPTGTVACRIRVYAPEANAGDRAPRSAYSVILCTRLDRTDSRDGATALGAEAVLALAARYFTPIGRPDAPKIERFLWIEGHGPRYALLSFAPNRGEGAAGWRASFGSVERRIPLALHEVIALTGDMSLAD